MGASALAESTKFDGWKFEDSEADIVGECVSQVMHHYAPTFANNPNAPMWTAVAAAVGVVIPKAWGYAKFRSKSKKESLNGHMPPPTKLKTDFETIQSHVKVQA